MTGAKPVLLRVIDTVALTIGCVCFVAAALAQAGRISLALDILSHFTPLWLLGGLLCGLWGLSFTPRGARRRLVMVGALALLAAALLIIPEVVRRRSPPAGADAAARIRLIQFNAWELNREPEVAAAWIARQAPDVVAVEELTPALRAALERRGFHGRPGLDPSLAVFSRSPPLPETVRVPPADWPLLPEFARATFPSPDGRGTFSLVSAHLEWPTRSQAWWRALRLVDFLGLYDHSRLVLVGDFNLTPWSFRLQQLDHRLGLERRDDFLPTWPAKVSVQGRLYGTPAYLPIDHVYAGPAWRTIMVRRGPFIGSDHYPLVVDLALEP